MLYPNFDGLISLSTNHLELGAHVKASPPPFNSTNFVNPAQLNSSYFDAEKEKTRSRLVTFDAVTFVFSSRIRIEGGNDGDQLPDSFLPSLDALPILNLTGYLSSQKALREKGDQ
jgi:hypothetical protein